MKMRQRLTSVGKLGIAAFIGGPIVAIGTREALLRYIESLRGTGITEMPDVTGYHAAIICGVIMFLASIPMLVVGREWYSD